VKALFTTSHSLQFILPPFASELQPDQRQGQNVFGARGYYFYSCENRCTGKKVVFGAAEL
jgi:hypothetical protein